MVDSGTRAVGRFLVAAVQFEPLFGNPPENRKRMIQWAVEAAKQGAKLIVFPEMCTSGYVWSHRSEITSFTETIPGPTTESLASVARAHSVYIVAGLPEVDPLTRKYYNTAVLVGPDGIVGKYRKTHLYAPDLRWACEGDLDIPVFKTPLGRIALLICMDAMYFEPARIAAVRGADIVAFPTNWVGETNSPPSSTWRLRAAENGVYWVAANRWGTERGIQFTGGTTVIDPYGRTDQWLLTGDGLILSWVALPVERSMVKRRRPEAYDDLVLPPMTWNEEEVLSLPPPGTFDLLVVQHPFSSGSARPPQIVAQLRRTLSWATDGQSGIPRLVVLAGIEAALPTSDFQDLLEELCVVATEGNAFLAVALSRGKEDQTEPAVFLLGPEGMMGSCHPVHAGPGPAQTDFRTFDLPFARVGMLTGEDAVFPESYRILSRRGADIIVVTSTGECASLEPWAMRIWARENDVVLAAAVPDKAGGSLIYHHKSIDEHASPQDGRLLVQRLDPDLLRAVRQKRHLRRLQPRWYDVLRKKGERIPSKEQSDEVSLLHEEAL